MSVPSQLAALARGQRFRQLFVVRLTSQTADGVFQTALASYVLFTPQNKPTATAIAAGLTALLLPFSLLGPFVGVFLDRWSRRQVLVVSNLLRLVPVLITVGVVAAGERGFWLFVLVLAALSVNRFFLAGLSASLPHVVKTSDLVLANSITPTCGTLAFTVGLGLASLAHTEMSFGDRDAILTAASAVGYLMAALLALRLPRHQLGPDYDPDRPQVREALGNVIAGLWAALLHLRDRPRPRRALAVVAVHRFLYGLVAVATVLLYRNTFYDSHHTNQALAGLATAVGASGLGFFLAAVLTPFAIQRISPRQWIVILLVVGAAAVAFPATTFTQVGIVIAAFVVGLSAQGVKICVDTLVQTGVDDAFRGRVFSIYDVLFNVAFVAAAAAAIVLLPTSGESIGLLLAVSVGFALTGLVYGLLDRRNRGHGDDTANHPV